LANVIAKDKLDEMKSIESAMKTVLLKNENVVHKKSDVNKQDVLVKKRGRPRKIQ